MQLDYEPSRTVRRPLLTLILAKFGVGMLVGTLVFALIIREVGFIACFPFYAVIPLIAFSISLLIRSWLLRGPQRESHTLLTLGGGATSIAAEFFGAWFISKVDITAGWEYPLWATVFLLPIMFGWLSLRRMEDAVS